MTQGVDFPHTNPPGIQPRELVLRLDGQDPDGDGFLGGTPPNGDWIDKSGLGHDASNVVDLDIAKPTYDPTRFDGRGGFVFEGNQGLESPFNFGSQFQPEADYTTFVVFKSNKDGSMFISADRPSNGPTHFTGLLDGQACVRIFAGTTLHTDENHFSDGNTHVLTYSVSTANDGKNTSSYFFTDEIQQPGPDVGSSNQTSSLVLGTRINENNQVSSQFHGEIAEFIIFKGTLSVQETKDIHAYLLSRWGESQKATSFELFQNASRSRGRMLLDPGSEPPLDPQSIHLDDKNLPPKHPDSDLLVVIVHGWQSSPNGNEGNFVDIRDGISFHSQTTGQNNVDVWLYDWSTDAAFDFEFGALFPSPKNENHAMVHGSRIADHIANQIDRGGGYKHVHLIGHSLGDESSNLRQRAWRIEK